ncbi:P27 family phage terminase small subunit [Thalassorhabdomicrobium marinisediminis]|uniref:Phage terminase small subunit P27 family n=1 Tax=Thalassorhabdomicrobium marinisediminis TaxID=2170577 RepID=A0A2T7FVB3_9RHOB|nr:P27 family phage terminase small subunit [Thalassorhabdomicrobium marinisediminis]PVA06110.1 phage terminase small subunit P27 family [Thalassorhabdomicrobium marinisediminis]
MSKHLRGIKPQAQKSKDALTKAPAVPSYFSPYAKAEWKRIMPRLIADRIITKADLGGVEEYCLMRGVVREIETNRALNSGDIDPKLFGVQNRAAQTARQLAAEYGLSPVSRARIGGAGDDEAEDDNPLNVR